MERILLLNELVGTSLVGRIFALATKLMLVGKRMNHRSCQYLLGWALMVWQLDHVGQLDNYLFVDALYPTKNINSVRSLAFTNRNVIFKINNMLVQLRTSTSFFIFSHPVDDG